MFLSLLILSSCATWKQKDFKKELDRPVAEAVPEVEVDKKLLDKFEVQPTEAEATVEVKKEEAIVVLKKTSIKKTEAPKLVVLKKVEAKPVVETKKLPKDYPPEMTDLNRKAELVWKQYKPNHTVGEKIYLDIHYLGMTVGKIMVVNNGKKTINGKEVWHLHARFKSAPFYSSIYELDDTVDTYVTTEDFLSIRFSLIQRESKVNIDDLQLNDREQLKTFWFYKQKKVNGKVKDKKDEKFIPFYSIDPFSVVFLYQGLPLKDGDEYEIPVINKAKMLVLKSKVEGRETISTEYGDRKAIRIHATTKYTGDTLKSGDLYFWMSDDGKHTLLKAQAKIKIGSVTADIVKD
jgi:Protein of unknown function (DUF3108)